MLGVDIAYSHTKFDHSSFNRSRDMVGTHQNLNDSGDLITSLSGMVCHPWAIALVQSIYLPNLKSPSPPTIKI